VYVITKYLGIATATGTNISAIVLTLKRKPLSLNLFLEKANAEHEQIINAPNTVITVVIILLKRYLDAGTLEDDDILKSIKKLLNVGCFTKNLGGYAISSSIGLKAFETMKSIGKPITIQIGIRYE
jgi:hypothetical protein